MYAWMNDMPCGNQTWQWVDLSVSIWPSLAGRCGDFPPRRETCQNTCRGTSFSGGAGRSSWVPRCVAKGSCFILGLWGWTCVRLTLFLCSRSQPPARLRWGRCGDYGRAYSDCCKSGHFWRFQTLCNVVSCGRCGALWHPNMFHCVSKVVLCGSRHTFARISEEDSPFSCQTSMFILRGMRSTLDMSCCRFFANRIVRAASSGDSVHIAVSFWMAGAAFCEDPILCGNFICIRIPWLVLL